MADTDTTETTATPITKEYTPTGMVHSAIVDFTLRGVYPPVHIVQYDETLPVIAVELYKNSQLYAIPDEAEVRLLFGKWDHTFVNKKALGCDSTRTVAYFEVTEQMTVLAGEFNPVVEIYIYDEKTQKAKKACSGSIKVIIDRNPIQNEDIESTYEYKELVTYRDEAKASQEAAKDSEEKSAVSEKNAKESEVNSKQSEINAASSEKNAKVSEEHAYISEVNSKSSETNAYNSEHNAESYMNQANSTLAETKQWLDDTFGDTRTFVYVDMTTGNLMYTGNKFIFTVNDTTGNLDWEVS